MTPRPVCQLLAEASEHLRRAGNRSARVDAELLLAHLLEVSRSALITAPALDERAAADYQALVGRRAGGVPLQHLTGRAPFRHLELEVGPGVFVPRPETELILELVAEALADARLVVDLGAGSGAIALSVAQEFPQAEVVAVEQSERALRWLSRNATLRSAAGDRAVEVVLGDIARADLLAGLDSTVDVVLSNPPYVPDAVRDLLDVEVSHDPDAAVFAGPDGLALMPALFGAAARLLRRGGTVIVEHDESHAARLVRIVDRTGNWQDIRLHDDLTHRPRFLSATRL